MSRYFSAPERYEMNERAEQLATDLAAAAAACVHVYGPRHLAIWDERENRFAAGMLNQIHEAGGKIIYTGTKPLPPRGSDGETWRRDDAPEHERRAWVEVKIPESDD